MKYDEQSCCRRAFFFIFLYCCHMYGAYFWVIAQLYTLTIEMQRFLTCLLSRSSLMSHLQLLFLNLHHLFIERNRMF